MKNLRLAAVAASILLSSSAMAVTVSVYDGNHGSNAFAPAFTGTGYTYSTLGSGFGASDIGGSQLVILAAVNAFSSSQLSALTSYVNGGGRLVLLADGSAFPSWRNSENAALAALGSSITDQATDYDPGYQTTANITANAFTAGVTNLQYGYSSSLTGGTTLIKGNSGQNLLSYEAIGDGYVFAFADTDITNGFSSSSFGNTQLFNNFVTANPAASAVPEPAAWGMMVLGFGLVGAVARRKSVRVRFA